MTRRSSIVVLALGFWALACRGATGDSDPLLLASVTPSTILPGTDLVLVGRGFRNTDTLKVRLAGAAAKGPLEIELAATFDHEERLRARVSEALVASAGEGTFSGSIELSRVRGGESSTVSIATQLVVERHLTPSLTALSPGDAYLGDALRLDGEGFLLGGHESVPEGGAEGQLELVAAGEFRGDRSGVRDMTGSSLPVIARTRTEAAYVLVPDWLGLDTGEFEGTFTPVNRHGDGTVIEGAPLPVRLTVLPTALASLGAAEASRGQKLTVNGHGFVEDAPSGLVTLLRFRGYFSPADESQHWMDVTLPIRVQGADKGVLVLDPRRSGDRLEGFGSEPGWFEGTVTPVVQNNVGELEGAAWSGNFRVLPVRQVVHLKYTPQFTEALRLFGLRNVEREVKDRVLEVVRRDYSGANVEFREEAPDDFALYTTMELTGDDPNDADLFGLDNTDGKDDGNLRLDDYIGSANADQASAGAYAYGGVFLATFLRFSPNVCRKVEEGVARYRSCSNGSQFPMRTARFDAVFAPFAPLLGGSEASEDEWRSGPRKPSLQEAVRVIGSLAGNTVTHELGHSLGLARDVGSDGVHNSGYVAGLIMNPGAARPFEERAELDGLGPARWSPGDRAYLMDVLRLR